MKDPIKMIEDAKAKGIPTFTLKATDKHAVAALQAYYTSIAQDENVSKDFSWEISGIMMEFVEYEDTKTPD